MTCKKCKQLNERVRYLTDERPYRKHNGTSIWICELCGAKNTAKIKPLFG